MDYLQLDILAVLSVALIPGVLWAWFFYKKDTLSPEPRKMIVRIFFIGMGCLVPVLILEYPFRGYTYLQVVLVAPVVEELIKFAGVRLTIYNNDEFNKPLDGITYSAICALGFASAENVFYIVGSYIAPQLALGKSDPLWALGMIWQLYVIRALLTVPGHAIWASMWGYALGWYKCISAKKTILARGFALSIVLHSLFNYFIITQPVGAIGMLILVPVMWKMIYNRIERSLQARSQ